MLGKSNNIVGLTSAWHLYSTFTAPLQDLVRLAVKWRRDCLGESAGLGLGGLFAGAEKKKKPFEAKVREDLGF